MRRRGEPQVELLRCFWGNREDRSRNWGLRGPSRGCVHPAKTEPSNGKQSEVHMKMVKSLLLGSAAGLAAVTAGQAADLPVKAKPVEYVKICSIYGAGFYYMPGTDLCIKIGGWVRAEAMTGNTTGSFTWGP